MAGTILVTGAAGQLGRELQRAPWPAGIVLESRTSSELDITDREAVLAEAERVKPNVIVNAAAYTAVDRAEHEEDRAFAVNAVGVAALAEAADLVDSLLVHVSTDYVFDGSKDGWYVESDPLRPLGAYGRSKAAGEQAALGARRALVLRTAWVYSVHGSNFVKTMLRLAGERDEVGVVDDQVGCPTSAADLAAAIVDLLALAERDGELAHRVCHVVAPDEATWHGFACAIFDLTGDSARLTCRKLTTAEYPTPAARPANSRLDTTRLAGMLGRRLPSWRDSLVRVLDELRVDESHRGAKGPSRPAEGQP